MDDLLENYRLTRGAGFGPEVKRRIILGTYALSAGYYDAYYLKAQQVRTLIKAEFDEVLSSVDALLAPTSPIGRVQDRRQDRRPAPHVPQRRLYPAGEHRRAAGDIGSLRAVRGAAGGFQVIGKAFDEATVLRVADAYERLAGFSQLRAPTAHD